MAKSYEFRLAQYQAKCRNMAGLEILSMKYQIACENAEGAGHFAARAARWVFEAHPELREVA